MSDECDEEQLEPGDEASPEETSAAENVCPACEGSGEVDGNQCSNCAGTGRIVEALGGG